MKNLTFTKMHGLGNDFMVIDGISQKVDLRPEIIAKLAERNTGIGFDQCLLVEKSPREGIDFYYRIFNADGQEVGQCGNGARCLALFVSHYGLTTKKSIKVATKTTEMQLDINKDGTVSACMGIPNLIPKLIPFQAEKQASEYLLELSKGQKVAIHAISLGNPHAVLSVPDIESAPVESLGREISLHPLFPEQTNTGFMQIVDKQTITLRVYERGCGETQACGSGAVAAAAIGRLYYQLAEEVRVQLRGGDLVVNWPDVKGNIRLTGPATFVYEGKLL